MNNDIEDRRLIEDFKNGREEAFDILYDKYSNFVKSYINKKIHNIDVSEEMMHEIFIFVYKHPERYKGKSKFINFVFGITKNKINEYWRKMNSSGSEVEIVDNELSEDDEIKSSYCYDIERKEESRELIDIISNLKPEYREVIELIDLEELSYDEAAKRLNKSVDQIRVTVHRARKKLKSEFERKYPDTARKYSKRNIIPMLLAAVIGISLLTGLVYAAIRLFKSHVQNKDTFKLEEINESVDESEVEITREHAKEIIDLYLGVLEQSDYELDDVNLMTDAIIGVREWTLKDEKFQIWIDANSGKLVRYDDYRGFYEFNNKELTIEYYIEKSQKMYNDLEFKEKYEFSEYETIDIKNGYNVLDIIYTKKYDNTNSDFEYIVFEFIKEIDLLHSIKVYDYKVNNNRISIDKDEAVNIVKLKYENAEIYNCILDVKLDYNMNFDNKNENNYLYEDYITKDIVNTRTVWKIEIKYNSIPKIVYVDAKNGYIVSTDEYSYGDLRIKKQPD